MPIIRSTLHRPAALLAASALLTITASCGGGGGEPPIALAATKSTVDALIEVLRSMDPALDEDLEKRLEHLETALDIESSHEVARLEAGWTCYQLEQFEDAARYFSEVSGPLRQSALLWEAHSLAAAGEESAAMRLYDERARAFSPSYWGPVALPGEAKVDDTARFVLHWSRAVKEDVKSGLYHWLHGNALANANRMTDAVVAYERAVEREPEFVAARVSLAMACHRSGRPDQGRALISEVLEADPDHLGALGVAGQIEWEVGDHLAVLPFYRRSLEARGRQTDAGELVRGAIAAWRVDDIEFGVQALNHVALWAGDSARTVMADTDEEVLRKLRREQIETPLDRYALASSIYATVVDTLENANPMLHGATLQLLESVNRLTLEDLAIRAQSERAAEAAVSRLDIMSAMSEGMFGQYLPHLGRARRELRAAIDEVPTFAAAKVLLAEIEHYVGNPDAATGLLQEVIDENDGAATLRIRLAERSPLDVGLVLMEGASEEDRRQARVVARLAGLLRQAGESEEAAALAMGLLTRVTTYWDMAEIVALDMKERGYKERALELLDLTHRVYRSATGSLVRAALRRDLSRGGQVEAAIDAWRAAATDSTEETQAVQLLRSVDTSSFACVRCSGSRTISVTSGSTGPYGSVNTYQETCPQCLGLGLWHAGVR